MMGMRKIKNILLVDGYNVIGAWPELRLLKEKDLSLARDRLIDIMAEYKAYTGYDVIIVFDAHLVEGRGKRERAHRIDVIYTNKNETADERIEKLVRELKRVDTRIYVATSDYTEQSLTFGSGALRISARELLIETQMMEKGIDNEVKKTQKRPFSTPLPLSDEIAEFFEKWRRER